MIQNSIQLLALLLQHNDKDYLKIFLSLEGWKCVYKSLLFANNNRDQHKVDAIIFYGTISVVALREYDLENEN